MWFWKLSKGIEGPITVMVALKGARLVGPCLVTMKLLFNFCLNSYKALLCSLELDLNRALQCDTNNAIVVNYRGFILNR